MFNYYLTQCSSINTLPFTGEWEHFKIATFHMLLPELHLKTKSIYFICACKQVFISALHSCVQFIQILKNICQVCQSCTTLITCKQLCVLRPSFVKKHFKFLSQLIHMSQYLAMRQPSDLYMKQQDFMLRSHFLTTKSRRCEFSQIATLLSLPCAQHHPTQERGLPVKSWL